MTAVRGRRVLITGAGHGLGKELARAFGRAGAEVVVTDRDLERVTATVSELMAAGVVASGHMLDVTEAEQVLAVRDRVLAERGPVDVLVNNAGVVFGGDFLSVPEARHRATVAVNLTGVLTMTHAFLPSLLERPAAHLVNVGSASALVALPFAASYAATKWAVLGLSESLREELRVRGRRNVRVTTVCPAYIDTGLFAGARPARLTWLLRAADVARRTVWAVERDRELLILPWTARLLHAVSGLMPRALFRRLCSWLGVDTGMAGWTGHGGPC
jgi:short-subunit dehydrogenase